MALRRIPARPLLTPPEALLEANRCQGCVDAPCQKGCPLAVDVGAFIRRIQTGNWAGALRVMYERNPLPETCALICPVETLCESKCNSGELSYPIRISELQQAAAHYGAETFRRQVKSLAQPAGTVAIIGGGPAGLACAARLRLDGFEVHLFEKTAMLGGALHWWIPAYRLPRKPLQDEIQRIIDLGVTVHTGQALGRDVSLADLRHKFDAVFLGMGLGSDRQSQMAGRSGTESSCAIPRHSPMECGGIDTAVDRPAGIQSGVTAAALHSAAPDCARSFGVFDALKMLEMANAGQLADLPEPVVVIGGGNTAIDAAVTARYLGSKEVYLIYRRSFTQMPAWPDERHRAVDLGIHVLILLRPIEYVRDGNGTLLGVQCLRTRLQPDPNGGRDIPVDVPDSEFVLPAGCVIEAIGQRPDDLTRSALACLTWTNGTLAVEADTQETSLPGVFAGGDMVNGGRTAVEAIAQALRAAEHITLYVHKHRSR